MLLSILERMLLGQVLPKEGSLTNLKLLREAREGLSFTEKENQILNFQQEEDQVRWDDVIVHNETGEPVEGDKAFVEKLYANDPDRYERKPAVGDTEISIGDVVTALIVKALKDLDQKEKLTEAHISLYEKFIT